MEINFVQISDLHHHFKNYESEKMRKELLKYLSGLTTAFDFLIITGDIVHKGSPFNSGVEVFLNEVIAAMKITKQNVYIVPGNHDISRDDTRELVIQGIKSSTEPSEKLDNTLRNNQASKKILFNSFNNFFKFYKKFIGEEYPTEEIHFIKTTDKFNIIHINTCLVAHTSKEEGTLLVARQKLLECLEKLEKGSAKINIAIGHHTLDCMGADDKIALETNFEDYSIDLYLSGHVHQPGYHVEANGYSEVLSIVSGAGLLDSYANGGFVTAKICTERAAAQVEYHTWNRDHHYWTVNTGVGRRAKTGVLSHPLKRFDGKQIADVKTPDEEINENEFKQFIIDFHQHPQRRGNDSKYKTKQKEIEDKFENMNCSETFEQLFLEYALFFSAIEEIMNSTSYIEAEKKEIVSELIIETYMGIHNNYSNGDEIFTQVVDTLFSSTGYMKLPYSLLKTKRYIKILVAWVIYDCGIFNEKKNKMKVN